jgi:acetyl-CoA carboxylase biotin carboxyl carrier protein
MLARKQQAWRAMDPDEIKALIEAFAATDLAEMELTHGDWRLRLARDAAGTPIANTTPAGGPPPPRLAPQAGEDGVLRAPLAGIVHLGPAPEAPAFMQAGCPVAAGDVVAVIEAMKVFNEIRADRAGTLGAVLVASGEEVMAGQPLMRIG